METAERYTRQMRSYMMKYILIVTLLAKFGLAADCPPACSCSKPLDPHDNFGVVVNCHNRHLSEIPFESLSVFTVQLDLSNNNITSIPAKVFSKFHFVRKLNLAHNSIQHLNGQSFEGLSRVESLNLSNNKINSIEGSHPSPFQPVQLLQTLDLSNNLIRKLSPGLFTTTRRLSTLDLSKNLIDALPAREFHLLSLLNTLNLRHNRLSSLEGMVFSDMLSLASLHLDNNLLTNVADNVFVGSIESLKTLTIEGNYLDKVPHGIRGLRRLELLSLAGNQIKSVPSNCFTDLVNLKFLNIDDNPLENISKTAFFNLRSLRKLHLTNLTHLSSFPDLTGCEEMEELEIQLQPQAIISTNLLLTTSSPSSSFSSWGDSTTQHTINSLCKLTPRLKKLTLTGMQLNLKATQLSLFISHCHMLEQLDLSNNRLTEIDMSLSFSTMHNLKFINLSRNNDLVNFQGFIPQPLKTLDLSYCEKITSLPAALIGNSRLDTIFLEGCTGLYDLNGWKNFDKLERIVVPYALQCCQFRQAVKRPSKTYLPTGIHCHTSRRTTTTIPPPLTFTEPQCNSLLAGYQTSIAGAWTVIILTTCFYISYLFLNIPTRCGPRLTSFKTTSTTNSDSHHNSLASSSNQPMIHKIYRPKHDLHKDLLLMLADSMLCCCVFMALLQNELTKSAGAENPLWQRAPKFQQNLSLWCLSGLSQFCFIFGLCLGSFVFFIKNTEENYLSKKSFQIPYPAKIFLVLLISSIAAFFSTKSPPCNNNLKVCLGFSIENNKTVTSLLVGSATLIAVFYSTITILYNYCKKSSAWSIIPQTQRLSLKYNLTQCGITLLTTLPLALVILLSRLVNQQPNQQEQPIIQHFLIWMVLLRPFCNALNMIVFSIFSKIVQTELNSSSHQLTATASNSSSPMSSLDKAVVSSTWKFVKNSDGGGSPIVQQNNSRNEFTFTSRASILERQLQEAWRVQYQDHETGCLFTQQDSGVSQGDSSDGAVVEITQPQVAPVYPPLGAISESLMGPPIYYQPVTQSLLKLRTVGEEYGTLPPPPTQPI